MKREFLDPEYVQKAIEDRQESLKVKTGLRAGDWPDPLPPYGLPPYGVEPYLQPTD
jgi:hypothetical protein